MICYKDKTFCGSKVKKHTCGREITEQELKHAEEIGMPIAYGDFCQQTSNDFLEKIVTDAEDAADALNDNGHQALIVDLKRMLADAEKGVYHDFHRNGADAPKVKMVSDLEALRQNVINGLYDN